MPSTHEVRSPAAGFSSRIAACAILVVMAAGAWAIAASDSPAAATQAGAAEPSPTGFYSADQAARGKTLFTRNCALCHSTVDSTRLEVATGGRGFWWGDQRLIRPLGGKYVQKYPSVYHLFRRVRDSMPPWNTESVSVDAKVDIVAYLLQAAGLPAGREALTSDVGLMKSETLNEPGFEKVFNGKDFTGIKFIRGMNCRPAPLGSCSTEPGSTFWVDPVRRELVASGKITGYWYQDKKYLNFTLRFDYRYDRPTDLDPDDPFFDGNSGYMLFIKEHQMWPVTIEVQGNDIDVLSVGGTIDREARQRVKRPAGEWNSVEIDNHDHTIRASLNGTLISTLAGHKFSEPGYIGFQSEGAQIHWRNIRIKADQ